MTRFIKKLSRKKGLHPGALVHVGEVHSEEIHITVIDYGPDHVQERSLEHIRDIERFRDTESVTWINIDGLSDPELIQEAGEVFGIHSLVLEDILNTGQRPKTEEYDGVLFTVLRMLSYDEEQDLVTSEQVSLILTGNTVLTFQERKGDVLDHVRERIRAGKTRIRKWGADYLAYALIDAVVDHYFMVLEKLGERTEQVEEQMISDPDPETLAIIHTMKRETIFFRKAVWPLREVVSNLIRSENPLITENTRLFLRDLHDHTIQVIDTIEAIRDVVSGMLDIYLSSVSNRMNEVMKVLTIFAAIFIPLTFIAGIYGMNFEWMPELKLKYGYFGVWGVILTVSISMILYFRKKRWM